MRYGRRWGNLWGREEPQDSEIEIEDTGNGNYTVYVTWPKVRSLDGLHYHVFLDGVLQDKVSEQYAIVDFGDAATHHVSIVTCGPSVNEEDTAWVAALDLPPGDKVALVWSGASDAAAFRIYRNSAGSTAADSLIATTKSSGYTTNHLDDGTWHFSVDSLDTAGNQRESSSVVTKTINTWPEPPTDLGLAGFTAQTAYLQWSGSTSTDVTEYRVYANFVNGSASSYVHVDSAAATTTATNTTISCTAPGTWEVFVRAYDGTYEENNVDQKSFVLTGVPPTLRTGIPNVPGNLQAKSVVSGQITLSWAYNAYGESAKGTQCNVYYDNATGTVDYTTAIATVNIPDHDLGRYNWVRSFSYTTTAALTNSSWYTFGVRAEDVGAVEEGNTVTISAKADATAPNDLDAISATVTI